MGGLEDRPILTQSHGSTVVDTEGKAYLDFQSGQMGAALGHQHPRIVKVIQDTVQSLLHAADPLLYAVGEESIKIVVEDDMAGQATRIERRLRSALDSHIHPL